jgi:hypothetical protein
VPLILGLSAIIIMMILITYYIGQSDMNLSRWPNPAQGSPSWCKVGFAAYLAVGGLLDFPSSREKISHPGIEPSTPPFKFGYLSTVIQ